MLLYTNKARVAELVDALDLGSSAARCKSSSLFSRTTNQVVSSDVNRLVCLHATYFLAFFLFGATRMQPKNLPKMPRLSDQLISKLKQPKTSTERFFVRDTLLNGFSVRVSSKSISFVLHKQHNKSRMLVVIGTYPFESCEQARMSSLDS